MQIRRLWLCWFLEKSFKTKMFIKKICSYRKIPLQSFMTSFYPAPRWKNMQRPKPTAHGKRMSKRMSAGIKWEGTSTFKRFFKKKNHTFQISFRKYVLIQKTLQWIKFPTKQNISTLTYHQVMEFCVINCSAELTFGTSAMGCKNPRQEI